jgi:type I restriction enzyme M protein
VALKKSQLYSSLWASCDELRGGMDASQYKDYILTLLFVKYVSDRAAAPNAQIEVPKGGGFADMAALKGDKEIGDKINKIIAKLAEKNDLKGVIDQADFNDEDKLGKGKEMQDRLSKLISIFGGLDFRANRAEGDDLLGDAYEYLMRHFATESGKSKGSYYTPAEVSRILAKVIGIENSTKLREPTIYDPTCGSGSLLLKAADEGAKNIAIYGQEKDLATWSLAKMNMVLHGHATAEVWKDDTLSSPYFKNKDDSLKQFDFAVANPPFSLKSWTHGFNPVHDIYNRFEFGIPPGKYGDYAFLLHLIKSLKSNGKGAIILPHGVLFRAKKEAGIRKRIIERGLVKGIIGLPANLFYGTGIPACIIVIDKENAHARAGIFMIDASKGFIKDGNKNRLRAQDIHRIVDTFVHQREHDRYSRMVPISEIASPANDYNLNIPRYIDSSEPEDLHDLEAHMRGGIPERDIDDLDRYWKVFPSLRAVLFGLGDRPGYAEAKVEAAKIKATILAHPEFTAFAGKVSHVFTQWCNAHKPLLMHGLRGKLKPKQVIVEISEDLMSRLVFEKVPLLDKYDAYQRLMDYWEATMQDDVELIASEGWVEAAKPRLAIDDKERKIKEEADLTIGRGRGSKKYKMDLLPPALVVAKYFRKEQAAIDALQVKADAAARILEEFVEEQSSAGEEGEDLMEEAKSEKGNVTKALVTARLKAIKKDKDAEEERGALEKCQALIEAEAAATDAVNEAQAALDENVLAKYGKLSEAEIKTLVVEDKWFPSLRTAIDGEVQRLTNALAGRVRELEERYEATLPEIEEEVGAYGGKVKFHLQAMGVAWE